MITELDFISILLITSVFLISIITTSVLTSILIKRLTKSGSVVIDGHKQDKRMIPRPGGPAIITGIVVGGIVLYVLFPNIEYLVLILSISIAFAIGFIDDKKTMKGWFKPVMLIVASIPLLVFILAYDDGLALPGYGMVTVPVLYGLLILASMPLIGNASNSFDVGNGIVSKSFLIAFCALFIAYGLSGTANEIGLIGIPIIASMLAFHHYHKLPTRIFPGDSGSITIGVAYIGFAIITHMEIIAIIAILPAILNSFIFLSSTKKIVEHRELKGKAVGLTEDWKLKANKEKAAVSLFRLMLAKGPLSEAQFGRDTYKMMAFSGFLAICIVGIASSWMVIPVLLVGIGFFMYGVKHKRLYIMITITALLIAGVIVPYIYSVSSFEHQVIQVLFMVPMIGGFVFILSIMRKKLLKPLYKEFEPIE